MSSMTLEQLRDWHRKCATICRRTNEPALANMHDNMADAIDAHLLSQGAEIERLTRGNIGYAQDNVNLIGREHIALKRAEFAESRLAAAYALLRDALHQWPSLSCDAFHHRKSDQHSGVEECGPLRRWRALYVAIQSHLSENTHDRA